MKTTIITCDVCKKQMNEKQKTRHETLGYCLYGEPYGVKIHFTAFGFYGQETYICDECLDNAILAHAEAIRKRKEQE